MAEISVLKQDVDSRSRFRAQAQNMILIALGSNLGGPWGSPRATILRALKELERGGIRLITVSPLIVTAPFGRRNQPVFVNAVAGIETHLPPEALMRRLHAIERDAGRRRAIRWGPRTLDLDLLDYRGMVRGHRGKGLVLPHPGIAERGFVLEPIAMIAPGWRHPASRLSAREMLRRLGGIREGRTLSSL
jgi:2-amino-4-hydroxy-6-hydroxymethyldihydropteridine diphosphokinase